MATRAEQFHGAAQRTGKPKHTSKRRPKKKAWGRDKQHANAKATHALEDSTGRPSRESTRKASNRAKADTALNLTEEKRKGAPTERARRTGVKGAKSKRVRGSR